MFSFSRPFVSIQMWILILVFALFSWQLYQLLVCLISLSCSFHFIALIESGSLCWQCAFGFPNMLLKVSASQWHGSTAAVCFLHIQTVRQGSFPTVPSCHFQHSGTLQQSRPSHTYTHTRHKSTNTHTLICAHEHTLCQNVCVPPLTVPQRILRLFHRRGHECTHIHTALIHTSHLCWHPGRDVREREQEHMLDRRLLRGDISLWMLSYKL